MAWLAGAAWLRVPLLHRFPAAGGLLLLHMALGEGDAQFGARFPALARNSFVLAALTALLAVAAALLLAYAARLRGSVLPRFANRIVGLGYAVPGSVIAVGVLIPVTRLDNWLAGWMAAPGRRQSRTADPNRRHRRAGLCLSDAFPGDSAADAWRPASERSRRAWTTLRAARLGPGATLRRVHLPLLRGSLLTGGIAGVCGCDEGAAGDAGDAALQLRHAGDAGLHAGGG
jgi:iron(III) transport system permease protein